MRTKRIQGSIFVGLLLVGAIAGCSREQAADASMASAEADVARGGAPAPAAPPVVAESQAVGPEQLASSAATFTDAQRKFIRSARAEFEVMNVYTTALAIEDEVATQGGFVVGNDIKAETQDVRRRSIGGGKLLELTEYTLHGELTVRVPSEKTQSFLRAIAGKMEFAAAPATVKGGKSATHLWWDGLAMPKNLANDRDTVFQVMMDGISESTVSSGNDLTIWIRSNDNITVGNSG